MSTIRHRSTALRIVISLIVLVVALGVHIAGSSTPATAATVYATYRTTDDVSARSTPTAAPTGVYGIPRGAAFGVECQVIGQPAGPYGNTLYFRTTYSGRVMYVPDTYTDSPHLAGQPPIAGIPMCGAAPAPAPAPTNTGVWVGSPVNGTFGLAGQPDTTPQGGHHRLVKASPQNDWAVDLTNGGAGQGVILYVAPSDSANNGRVSTVISQIIDDSACRQGGGGDLVTVQIRFDGRTVGQVTYAHLDRNGSLSVGQTVNRWGTSMGTVADLRGGATGGSACWTGPHVHTELRASTGYACWNRGYAVGQALSRPNFIGFVSGPSVASTARPCP